MATFFEPLERLSNAHGNIEGTGIGLTVIKTLINAMNGTIYVEGEAGKGSKFCVELFLTSINNQDTLTTNEDCR